MTELRPIQERCIALLVQGTNIEDCARTLEISSGTIYKWLRQAAFTTALDARRAAVRAELHNAALSLGSEALEKIAALMRDTSAPKRVQLAAAEKILQRVDGSETTDLLRRLEALEWPQASQPSEVE